ncbi:MAG: DNA polymerase III subunit gamma/tau [Proteobacteria bacterium]|nr:DNA polymerase III subunit gamma/tau [Pseudomonadota bacterium]
MSDREEPAAYRVLARKYRPTNFAELIGQNALVQTLSNAIETGRVAHAFMLTGVRGVGKTTTARIIAKALNCIGPDGNGKATIEPCGVCQNCTAITEDRHVDVMEMDAASRTGVDDIRELIDGVRYRPSSARFKVYIIDEVHMLSKNAFNALLKTLEEPPEHVKFVFATTEIRKVPVTVLSRCQRFDLRRIDIDVLNQHFKSVAEKESVEVAPEALQLISRAADGSVRDGLSLLDQAIALSNGPVTGELVQSMLGLADRAAVFDLYEALMSGDIKQGLEILSSMYANGADPVVVVQDLLDVTCWVTRLKIAPEIGQAIYTPEIERLRGGAFAEKLAMPVLTRNWQLLLKGLSEVQSAPSPLQAAEMVLVRIAYAAELPPTADMVKQMRDAGSGPDASAPVAAAPAPAAPPDHTASEPPPPITSPDRSGAATAPMLQPEPISQPEAVPDIQQELAPKSFRDVIELFADRREAAICTSLRNNVHLVHFETGRIEFRPDTHAPRDLASRTAARLTEWTGERWVVSISQAEGGPTVVSQEAAEAQSARDAVEALPLVQAAMTAFPGARVSKVTPKFTLADDDILPAQEEMEDED